MKDKVSDLVVEQTELTFKATGSRQDIYIKFKEWVQSYSRKDYKDEVVKYLSLSSVLPNYDFDITNFFNFFKEVLNFLNFSFIIRYVKIF